MQLLCVYVYKAMASRNTRARAASQVTEMCDIQVLEQEDVILTEDGEIVFSSNDAEDEEMQNESCNDSDDGDRNKMKMNDLTFVLLVEKYGKPLLSKSQTPSMRTKKASALNELSQQMLMQFGFSMAEAQIKKKINNMKSRAKVKSDTKKTGNKPIVLSKAEAKLLDLLHATENPSITSLSCECFSLSVMNPLCVIFVIPSLCFLLSALCMCVCLCLWCRWNGCRSGRDG